MSDDKQLIHQGNLINLYKERVELPAGGHTYFDIVRHPGGAVIGAINDRDEICLLKQWRHAIGKSIWELPAGCIEVGEPPLETAKRELEEEAGVTASEWHDLGKIVSTPGFSDEVLYLYCAKGISDGQQKFDDAEIIDTHWIALDKALEMARNGEITDAKTLALLMRLKT